MTKKQHYETRAQQTDMRELVLQGSNLCWNHQLVAHGQIQTTKASKPTRELIRKYTSNTVISFECPVPKVSVQKKVWPLGKYSWWPLTYTFKYNQARRQWHIFTFYDEKKTNHSSWSRFIRSKTKIPLTPWKSKCCHQCLITIFPWESWVKSISSSSANNVLWTHFLTAPVLALLSLRGLLGCHCLCAITLNPSESCVNNADRLFSSSHLLCCLFPCFLRGELLSVLFLNNDIGLGTTLSSKGFIVCFPADTVFDLSNSCVDRVWFWENGKWQLDKHLLFSFSSSK